MKILQDLVLGCNKVIGKALVLDEIINYIQSLQRQVEFLSMKLEAVNTRMTLAIKVFPTKEHQNYKIVYRRYASLFFLVGVDNDECELDIMFHLEKAISYWRKWS